jgi:hypothetical protein
MKKLQTRPEFVEAVQYMGDGKVESPPPSWWKAGRQSGAIHIGAQSGFAYVSGLAGSTAAQPGDWIIRYADGMMRAVPDAQLYALYRDADDDD